MTGKEHLLRNFSLANITHTHTHTHTVKKNLKGKEIKYYNTSKEKHQQHLSCLPNNLNSDPLVTG